MRDYNKIKLREQNPKLYVQKMPTYNIWHGEKVEKELVKRYIDEIDLEENKREFFKFIIEDEK